jgi:NADPH:quinone reductase-like Zn-dependent oxidoreductase
MRAVTIDRYGGPEVLEVREAPEPKVGPDSVLVRMSAASINPIDYKIVQGYLDAAFPVLWPLVPGWDVSGEVVRVGPAVRDVRPGERVFGYARMDHVGTGSWADLVAMPIRSVAAAPRSLDPVAAGCLPLVGLTSWQSLVEVLEVGAGETVLIHAATGGVGHVATQIALARGARVIGTTSPGNAGYLESLGAEAVPYGDGLVERVRAVAPAGVDAVLDLIGGQALEESPALLRTPGRLVSIMDAARVTALGGTYVFARPHVGHLAELAALADAGRLVPHLQAVHPLEEVRTAVGEAMTGHVRGKIVLRIG